MRVFMTQSQQDVSFSRRSGDISKKVGGLSCFSKGYILHFLRFLHGERERVLLHFFPISLLVGSFLPCSVEGNCAA